MKHLITPVCLFLAISATAAERLDNLLVDQAIQIALQNHRSMQVSQAALEMAEAQFQQAVAAFGPKLNLEAGIQRADQDRTFTFIVKTPPAAELIKKAAGLKSGSARPHKDKVAHLSADQVREIANTKLPDLNANDIDAAMKIVAGTARSMGVTVDL